MRSNNEILDLLEMSAEMEHLNRVVLDIYKENKPLLNGEHFITDNELAALLKVSRRTLLQWRASGYLSYHQLGGKILYKESDVQELLDRYYYKAFSVQ